MGIGKKGVIRIKKRYVYNLLVILFGIIIALIIGELSVRIIAPQRIYNNCTGEFEGFHEVELNQYYGRFLKKDYRQCTVSPDNYKKIDYRTHNSLGARATYEIPYEKTEGQKRIVLIGDSFIYGLNIDDSETIASQLKKLLPADWEVINLGVPGFGTDQSLLLLMQEASKYKPDIVIYGLYQNDFSNNIALYQHETYKPMFQLTENGSIVLTNYPVAKLEKKPFKPEYTGFDKFMRKYSHLWTLYQEKKGAIKALFSKPEKKDYFNSYFDSEVYSLEKNYRQNMQYAMILTLNLIKQMQIESAKGNAEFMLINFPSRLQVNPADQELLFEGYHNVDMDYFELDKENKMMQEFAKEQNMTYIDFLPMAQQDWTKLYFRNDGHFSANGAKMIAQEIYNKMKEERLI